MLAITLLALTLSQAKNYAAIGAVAFFALAIASWWIMKELVKKMIMIVVCVALGGLFWFQRSNLTECASKVGDQVLAGANVECSFFGTNVSIPTRPAN